ncbi:MAG: DUF1329 domain-containing protein [Desulfuromonadales bacterium]
MLSIKAISRQRFIAASAVTMVMALTSTTPAWAKATPEELAKLGMSGTELTPAGAIRAGNAEGTIPEWKFEPIPVPANFKPGGFHPDPYAADKPVFTITAQNHKQYADKLSDGQKKMFETYPDYKMNIYPTRRSAIFKEYVYQAALENAGRAEATANEKGEQGFKNAVIAWAFPVPHNGNEALMNIVTHPQQPYQYYWDNTAAVSTGGAYQVGKITIKAFRPWSLPENKVDSLNPEEIGTGIHANQTVVSPAKSAGQVILAVDPMVYTQHQRQAWLYNPGQRRVKRAPQIIHDFPSTGTDGLATTDQRWGWLGPNERYDWTLEGRQEMYIPYNAYKLHSGDTKIADIITPEGRLNPDLARYELHRVWKLVGTLRKGISHVYGKRVFYVDEDTWIPVFHDNYDLRGQLWRFWEQHLVNWYDVGFMNDTIINQYDITAGRVVVLGLDNDGPGPSFTWRPEPNEYTPAAIRQAGVR